MKRDPRKRITSVLLSLALMLTMVALPSMAMPVQAADAKIQTGLQNVVIGTGTNTTPTVIGFGGKQWVVIGYNGTGVNSQTGNMTLLLSKDSSYGSTEYDDTSSYSNVYSGSTLHAAMTSAGNTPLSEEQSLIIPVGLEGGSANGSGTINDDKMAGESVADQLFWPLSVSEAESLNNNVRMFTDNWWLRSAGFIHHDAAFVDDSGNVYSNGSVVIGIDGVRPAFKINLTSVIFSSSAAGGKPTTVGANLSAATQPTAEQKLTVIDSGQTLNVIATTAEQSQSGGTLSFSYDGATTGTNQWVSCVLEQGGAVKYYGKLKDTSVNDSGTLSIPLSGVTNGTYTLRIFSEQDNGTNYTDFASTPVDMKVKITGGNGTVSGYTGSSAVAPTIGGGDTATTDTISLFEGYAEYTKTYTITGAPAPNVSVTSDGGTGATLSGNRLTIPTGLAANTYTITLTATNSQGSATMTVTVEVLEEPTAPTVTPASLTLQEGNSGTFSVTRGTGTDKATSVNIISDNTTVATVDTATLNANGTVTVTGAAEGVANIYLAWTGGSLDGTTSTVAVTVSKLPVVTHTITLGASGSGTVTGGGSYAKNTTATVTAKADTGWHFVSWTENGNVVSTGASYSFTVTGNRSLVAEFEQGLVPIIAVTAIELSPAYWTMRRGFSEQVYAQIIPENASVQDVLWRSSNPAVATVDDTGWVVGVAIGTATITVTTVDGGFTANCYVTVTRDEIISSGSSSSSSGGTSKADVSPVAGRPFTKPDATRLFNAALAAKPEGQTSLSIKARNYTSADKAVLAELAALAEKNDVTLTVHFDTVKGGKVTIRISINPAAVTTSLNLTVKLVGNKITLPKFAVPVEVAVKMPAGMTIETLKITQNGVDITASAKPWLDKNGYLHFSSTGGEIVLANK